MGLLSACRTFGKLHAAKRDFDRAKREHPLTYLFWETTLGCNLACRHCGSRCSPEQGQKTDLPGAEVRRIFREIGSFTGMELIVAEDAGEVVGSTVLIIVPNLSHSGLPWAIVENVIVDQSRRGQGIGWDLMKYVEARAREAGCYKIGLSSDNSRKEAHEFYRSLGYKATAQGFRLYL